MSFEYALFTTGKDVAYLFVKMIPDSFLMKLDNPLFNKIQKQAENSPRLRMHFDLRTQADLSRWVGVALEADEPCCYGSRGYESFDS